MNVYELKEKLTQFAEELNLNHSIIDAINSEVQGNERDPNADLELLHQKIKANNLNDREVKNILYLENKTNVLYGHSCIIDYYLIFLGFEVPVGGYDWLNSDADLIHWYKLRIHNTKYGRVALRAKFGTIYDFKVKVAEACQRWLFSSWRIFNEQDIKHADITMLKNQISTVKNARLIIDLSILQKIFEFSTKDFLYNTEIINFLTGYDFDIKKFEENLVKNIIEFGCEYRKRLDDCFELIFS